MSCKFTILIHSGFAELWRYNTAVMCGGSDAAGNRVDFVSAQSTVAPVGADLKAAPEGAERNRDLKVTTAGCDSIVAYVYVIPNTLPLSREVDDCRPFDLRIKVSCDDETIYDTVHKINQWSGASVELKLPADNRRDKKMHKSE